MYLPAELHCHTIHSDGDFTVEELQKAAIRDHLSLIALTDHNTVSGLDELKPSLCKFIKGEELTTYFGHILVLDASGTVDWRDITPDNIDEKVKEIKALGGLVGIAHPYQLGSPMCTGGRCEFNVRNWRNIDYIEIWHGAFSKDNYENEKALSMWTSLLDRGYHIAATYGRDWHRNESGDKHFGCTYVDFEDEISAENAKKAIRLGKTVVSTGAKFFFRVHKHGNTYEIGDTVHKGNVTFSFFTDLHARQKDAGNEDVKYKTIKIVTNGGKVVLETVYDERHVRLRLEKEHWYRAELWGTVDGVPQSLAITSPIYAE